jgi:Carboxypeptidase regulatory-like domain/TonB dependent receptor/TonB-dependent Receptor Plug Domain
VYFVQISSKFLSAFRVFPKRKIHLPHLSDCKHPCWPLLVPIGLYRPQCHYRSLALKILRIVLSAAIPGYCCAQTPSTGALGGVTLDSSGALLQGAAVTLTSRDTGQTRTASSDEEGRFGFLLLTPGNYKVCVSKADFAELCNSEISIHVTETRRLELRLKLAIVVHHEEISGETQMVQTDNSALGRVVNETAVSRLPLVTRNFAQIATLSPGVIAGVPNAGELGFGGTALSQINKSNDGIFVHGSRSYDNNWQLDGISVSDVQGNGAGSGGIPIPNPDTIQEFKVQTGLYDAAYGRFAGANVSVITKSGGSDYHGTAFEFFRNSVLNANDFFRNQVRQPRPVLNQNAFGFVLGGPIKKDKLFFFGSYQGMRQVNGLAAGQVRVACSATLISPPLTNDRTAGALGTLFGGMTGALGGVAVKADGSNINPVALALLNFKLPDGSFLIPTPQTVDPTKPFASQGFSAVSQPCHFDEDQFVTNVDFVSSQKSRISGRFFFAADDQTVAFPGNFFNPVANGSGFSSFADGGYRVFSLAHTYIMSNSQLNEARVGYVRTRNSTQSTPPFKWSDVGVAEGELSEANELPNLNIVGSVAFSSAFPYTFTQNSYVLGDTLSIVHGAHALRFGGSLTRLQDNFGDPGIGSFVQFLSWPDFLLGLNGEDNGTKTFSNVYASIDDFGLFDRNYRVWEGSLFAQDDYRIRKSLTLNLGLRYERLGQFGDSLGRNSSFDISKADPNPPAGGTIAGYVVASNFKGVVPPGVRRADNTFANNGEGQNTIAPRIGFAWQVLPRNNLLVLRGGYGLYFSRPTGQAFFQNGAGAPFALLRLNTGPENAAASFQSPFPQPFPTPRDFPVFPSYSPNSTITIFTTSPGFRPGVIQQFSLNAQGELGDDWLLEVGYVGARGTHLQRLRSLNQASLASPENPIRGTTTNTVANVPLRVPILGVQADSLQEVESEGSSWYNGLEASLTKRLSHGFQFLASYTFSKTLDTDGADINGTSAGIVLTLGDQDSPKQRWGRASFDRTQRFILSGTWSIPSPHLRPALPILGGWALDAILTIQSGSALTIASTNSANVFGISEDRAQLTGNCTRSQLVRGGSVESKLNSYFNAFCFTTPPVIGTDGIGTGFGDSATGIVDGPGQANLDLLLSKTMTFDWPREKSSLTFSAGFYNAFNHPQFANPDSNFTSPTFGVISATAVGPRVIQLALKFAF